MSQAKERPIIFKGEMVRAILDGRKTQTRRLVKGPCPYGVAGDRFWVRESLTAVQPGNHRQPPMLAYAADNVWVEPGTTAWKKAVSSIHMPRWASRITLEITNIRYEHLRDISEADAKAEGVCGQLEAVKAGFSWYDKPRKAFRSLWESINGKESWFSDPLVWVIEFKRVE